MASEEERKKYVEGTAILVRWLAQDVRTFREPLNELLAFLSVHESDRASKSSSVDCPNTCGWLRCHNCYVSSRVVKERQLSKGVSLSVLSEVEPIFADTKRSLVNDEEFLSDVSLRQQWVSRPSENASLLHRIHHRVDLFLLHVLKEVAFA